MTNFNLTNDFGGISFSFEDDYVHIYNLYVKPEYRNMGHAKSLIELAINIIKHLGYNDEIQIVANPKEQDIDIERLKLFYKSFNLKVFDYYG